MAEEQTSEATEQTTTEETTSTGGEGLGITRPEGLPDDYWDAEKNSPRLDAMTEALGKLPDLEAFKAQTESALAQRPESADDYEIGLPDDFEMPEELEAAGVKVEFDADSEQMKAFRSFAHEKGFTDADFKQALGLLAGYQVEQHQAAIAKGDEAMKALPKSEARQEAATKFVDAKGLSGLFSSNPVERLEATEKLMRVPGMTAAPGATKDPKKIDTTGMTSRQMLAAANEQLAAR